MLALVDFDNYFLSQNHFSQFVSLFRKIQSYYETKRFDRITFIGELLLSIADNKVDPKLRILILSSILELLLTGMPEKQYNAEESITKQFKLKTGVVLNRKKGCDLKLITKRIGDFYDLRSKIAHGDFKNLQKVIDKLKKENDNDCLERLAREFSDYVTDIFDVYLNEPDYIDTLREL